MHIAYHTCEYISGEEEKKRMSTIENSKWNSKMTAMSNMARTLIIYLKKIESWVEQQQQKNNNNVETEN